MIEVIKKTGEIEPLQEEKIKTCIARVGGTYELAERVCQELLPTLPPRVTSAEIYQKLFERLRQENLFFSLKLNLKRAIFELGPTGYPFEQYFASLLSRFGYQTETNLILEGKCVKHEIDIRASKDNQQFITECKFHQQWNRKSDIQIPLYTFARVLDINEKNKTNYIPWLVTNTKLSLDAVHYGECQAMKLTAWRYPFGESLEAMIEKVKGYPVTILVSANRTICNALIKNRIVLVEDFLRFSKTDIAQIANIPAVVADQLFAEARMLIQ